MAFIVDTRDLGALGIYKARATLKGLTRVFQAFQTQWTVIAHRAFVAILGLAGEGHTDGFEEINAVEIDIAFIANKLFAFILDAKPLFAERTVIIIPAVTIKGGDTRAEHTEGTKRTMSINTTFTRIPFLTRMLSANRIRIEISTIGIHITRRPIPIFTR